LQIWSTVDGYGALCRHVVNGELRRIQVFRRGGSTKWGSGGILHWEILELQVLENAISAIQGKQRDFKMPFFSAA